MPYSTLENTPDELEVGRSEQDNERFQPYVLCLETKFQQTKARFHPIRCL